MEPQCDARTCEGGSGLPSVLRESAYNATEVLNIVIGTTDENHVFSEDFIVEENELVACTSQLWLLPLLIGLAFASIVAKRRQDDTRRACTCSQQRWRSTSVKLSLVKLYLCEKQRPSEFAISMWWCALMVSQDVAHLKDRPTSVISQFIPTSASDLL